jgi:N6-adenosine-specific RNA methylase IME4
MSKREPVKFKTIVIDPPWPGPVGCPAFKSHGAADMLIPYTTQTGVQVATMRIPKIAAPGSQLWIWATSRSLGDASLLMQLWGYSYRALFVWKKRLGMGRHVRHECEFLLWGGVAGALLVKPKDCPRQVHEWPKPKRHSEKPAEAYEFIRFLSEGPRIDIFARQRRPGFTPWGNESTLTISQDETEA